MDVQFIFTILGLTVILIFKPAFQITKNRVDNFSSEKSGIPECVLLLKWNQRDKAPDVVDHKVKLLGTDEEEDFFRIIYHPG